MIYEKHRWDNSLLRRIHTGSAGGTIFLLPDSERTAYMEYVIQKHTKERLSRTSSPHGCNSDYSQVQPASGTELAYRVHHILLCTEHIAADQLLPPEVYVHLWHHETSLRAQGYEITWQGRPSRTSQLRAKWGSSSPEKMWAKSI